ncbi:MAG TPA: arsenate reductase family protein [Mycobacteriales bacterium]|jgi:arsenate reductase|nr:arsenate reductase family protein [Mycobacteriales bacterium]
MEIWFNPSCSKCRASEELLDEAGVAYTERRYLDQPPTVEELDRVTRLLGVEPWDLTRMDEGRAKELDLANAPRDREAWLRTLADNPILVQRPIVITDDGRAVIGRPPEKILDLLKG